MTLMTYGATYKGNVKFTLLDKMREGEKVRILVESPYRDAYVITRTVKRSRYGLCFLFGQALCLECMFK